MNENLQGIENDLHQLVQRWQKNKSDAILTQIVAKQQEFVNLIQSLGSNQRYTFKDIDNRVEIRAEPFILSTFNPIFLHLDLLLVYKFPAT